MSYNQQILLSSKLTPLFKFVLVPIVLAYFNYILLSNIALIPVGDRIPLFLFVNISAILVSVPMFLCSEVRYGSDAVVIRWFSSTTVVQRESIIGLNRFLYFYRLKFLSNGTQRRAIFFPHVHEAMVNVITTPPSIARFIAWALLKDQRGRKRPND